jgi:hypothetical protein
MLVINHLPAGSNPQTCAGTGRKEVAHGSARLIDGVGFNVPQTTQKGRKLP